MRSQYGAYTIIRESAHSVAPGSGSGANIAAEYMGANLTPKPPSPSKMA
jgi:hypothetical protein